MLVINKAKENPELAPFTAALQQGPVLARRNSIGYVVEWNSDPMAAG